VGEGRSSGLGWAAGPAVLVAFLAASPVAFVLDAVDGFEQVKVLLLVTAVLAVAGLAPHLLDPRPPDRGRPRGPALVALLYGGAAVLSTVFSSSPLTSLAGADQSHAGLLMVASTVAFFLVARRLCLEARRRGAFTTALAVGAGGASAYAALQVAGADPLQWTHRAAFGDWPRPFGTMGHPNHLGGLLALVLPVQIWLVQTALARRRRVAGGILAVGTVLSVAMIVATLSRTAWCAALVGALVLLVPTLPRRRLAAVGAGLALSLVVGGLVARSGASAASFSGALSERIKAAVVVGPRLQIWRAAGEAFLDAPVLGSGLDTFALAFQRHRPPLYWTKEYDATPAKAHNEVLHALATQGLVGAAAWLLVVGGAAVLGVRALRRGRGEERGLAAALLGSVAVFLVLAQTGFAVVVHVAIFALGAAVLAALADGSSRPASVDGAAGPAARLAVLSAAGAFGGGLLSTHAPLGLGKCLAALAVVSVVAGSVGWAAADVFDDGAPSVENARPGPTPGIAWKVAVGVVWVLVVLLPLVASVSAKRAETAPSPAEGIALLDRASRFDPLRVLYRRRLGLALARPDASDPGDRTSRLLRSREVLARAVRLVPGDAYGWASLSAAETKLAAAGLLEKDQPFRSFDEALRRDPANVTFRTAGANAALELGDLARARRYAEEAAAVLPDFGPAQAQLAHVAAREGRLEDAVRLLREALALQWYGQAEAHHVAQANLASLLVRAGRFSEAEQEARSLAEGAPLFAPGRYQLARALDALGRQEEAALEYASTLRLDPSHRGARDALRARPSP
jgi:O-antigen ligase/tetratricopeptide (TPR) repeat protein